VDCVSCEAPAPPGARFCPFCGAALRSAESPAESPAQERKLVTVVFCDLVGSTELSEQLDPETLRAVTLRYFAAMRGEIERYGGTVEKFIGDAVMAVFGVPVMHEDDAARAVAAALGMRTALAELNADLASGLGVTLRIRIGVHTGAVVTGTEISGRQALVSGQTVNVAARLQSAAAPGEILIGPLTREAAGPMAQVAAAGPLTLKGVQEPVPGFRLLGLGADSPELRRRFDVPFVGRSAELAALDRALEQVIAAGTPQLVTLYGEPGIGKTRLVLHWLSLLQSGRLERPVVHGLGRCRPYGEHGTLSALAEAVHQLPGPAVPRAARRVLDAGLLRDGTPGPDLDATCAALAWSLAAVADHRPVVLVLDDCHWGGDLLLDVVQRLTAARAGATLLICVARHELLERRCDWARRGAAIQLPGLSPDECAAVAGTLAEVSAHLAGAPPDFATLAGGNPFFLEQLYAAAAEADNLPHTLQALIGARVDALEAAERSVLESAAVWGTEFTASQVEMPGAAGSLATLVRRRMIEEGPAAGAYRFRNGLIRNAVYQAMSKGGRADRHEKAADSLIARGAAPATIGTHLESAYLLRTELGLADAGLRLRAAATIAEAGAIAGGRSDLAWAENLLDRALRLLTPADPGLSAVRRRLGEVRLALGQDHSGRELLRAVAAGGDEVDAAHARLWLAVAGGASIDEVAETACRVLPIFRAAGDELGQARARIRAAQARQLHGRHSDAVVLLRRGLAHAVAGAAEPEQALALGAFGISLWRGPTPVPLAIDRCRELLREYGVSRPVVRVTLGCPLAVLLALGNRPDDGREVLAEAARLAGELGYAEAKVAVPRFASAVEAAAGRPADALRHTDLAASAAAALGGGPVVSIGLEAARLLLDLGRPAEAARRLTDAVSGALSRSEQARSEQADLDGLRARLGSAEGARALARRAVQAAAATDSPLVQAVAALDQAETLLRLGLPRRAAAAAEQARRRFEAKQYWAGAGRARRLAELGLAGSGLAELGPAGLGEAT
jgi:class 3 adenylate cyclase